MIMIHIPIHLRQEYSIPHSRKEIVIKNIMCVVSFCLCTTSSFLSDDIRKILLRLIMELVNTDSFQFEQQIKYVVRRERTSCA
jgi:hypothetical protein